MLPATLSHFQLFQVSRGARGWPLRHAANLELPQHSIARRIVFLWTELIADTSVCQLPRNCVRTDLFARLSDKCLESHSVNPALPLSLARSILCFRAYHAASSARPRSSAFCGRKMW